MEWVWEIFKVYIRKQFARQGNDSPSDEEVQNAFLSLLGKSTVTILVQEPWQNSVRFKGLARHKVPDVMDLIHEPMTYLFDKYGGGKYKLNFHDGWNFIATQNFKPEGESKWPDMPEIDF